MSITPQQRIDWTRRYLESVVENLDTKVLNFVGDYADLLENPGRFETELEDLINRIEDVIDEHLLRLKYQSYNYDGEDEYVEEADEDTGYHVVG